MKLVINKETYNNKYLADKYSKYANDELKKEGIPYINFPFEIHELRAEQKFVSWVLIDYDSNPVVQFSWIHWMVGNYNISHTNEHIPEGIINSSKKYTKGINSFAGPLTNIKSEELIYNYGGPTPPDCDHIYTLEVYAHNSELNLKDGYFYNDLLNELDKVNYEKKIMKILART